MCTTIESYGISAIVRHMNSPELYDVVVIGGGPAGMMAAGRAGEAGARVLLIEKNPSLGKKLLITGGGRCNVTNAEFDVRTLTEKYGDKGKFLFSPFSKFGVQEVIKFFELKNMPIKIEAENRAFPKSNTAKSVFDVLVAYMKENKVEILFKTEVKGFIKEDNKITGVTTTSAQKQQSRTIKARSFILATGGKSRPETGSTGDGFTWLKEIGHSVKEPVAALVPITIKEDWVKELQGQSLSNVRLSVLQNDKQEESRIGKLLFTHFGISGPLTLNMSKDIRDLFDYGDVTLSLDLFPELNHQELDKKLQEIWKIEQNKYFKNSLSQFVPPKIASVIVELSGINKELFVNKVPKEERLKIIKMVKDLRMTVTGFLGEEKAIVTSGGISLTEVDFKAMRSLIYSNLYLAGDILDFDRPSGGFSLQLCWTTGYIAGENAAL